MNELNDKEIEQLERELRSYGAPYDEREPDERYFANFRARVLERIAAEPAGFGKRASEFFFGSPMRIALTGGSLVAAILLYFYLQSGAPALPVAQEQPAQELIAPEPPRAIEPQTAEPQNQEIAQPAESTAAALQKKENKPQHLDSAPAPAAHEAQVGPEAKAAADAAAEFERIDELSLSDESEPVSYDRLSVDELEAILKTLEGERNR